MHADIDDDGFLNITVQLPNDDEIPLTVLASQLLFGTDRQAYKQAVNACKEVHAASKPEDEEAA